VDLQYCSPLAQFPAQIEKAQCNLIQSPTEYTDDTRAKADQEFGHVVLDDCPSLTTLDHS
jgi:hypothetical protein